MPRLSDKLVAPGVIVFRVTETGPSGADPETLNRTWPNTTVVPASTLVPFPLFDRSDASIVWPGPGNGVKSLMIGPAKESPAKMYGPDVEVVTLVKVIPEPEGTEISKLKAPIF